MRIAILIVSIFGTVICLCLVGFQGCVACQQGGCAACMAAARPAVANIEESNASEGAGDFPEQADTAFGEIASAAGTLALANLLSGVGLFLQAILGLWGGIIAFSKLGGGQKAKKGAVLLSIGLGVTALAHIIGIIMVLNIYETALPSKNDLAIDILVILVIGLFLHGIATVMAFLAKPNQSTSTDAPITD